MMSLLDSKMRQKSLLYRGRFLYSKLLKLNFGSRSCDFGGLLDFGYRTLDFGGLSDFGSRTCDFGLGNNSNIGNLIRYHNSEIRN